MGLQEKSHCRSRRKQNAIKNLHSPPHYWWHVIQGYHRIQLQGVMFPSQSKWMTACDGWWCTAVHRNPRQFWALKSHSPSCMLDKWVSLAPQWTVDLQEEKPEPRVPGMTSGSKQRNISGSKSNSKWNQQMCQLVHSSGPLNLLFPLPIMLFLQLHNNPPVFSFISLTITSIDRAFMASDSLSGNLQQRQFT